MRAVGHVAGRLDARELDVAPADQGELQAEQLVVGQAAPGPLRGGGRGREVYLAQGPGERHEAVARGEGRREPVAHVAGVGERRGHDPAHPRGAQALPHRVHREHARVPAGVTRGPHDLVEGGPHLPEAVAEGHLPGERHHVSGLELLGDPRLAEERRHEHARLVDDPDLDHLHARPRALEAHLVDRGDDGGVGAHVGHRDGSHAREVEVAARDVEQEVAHAPHAQPLERGLARTAHVAQPRHRVGEGAGSLHPLRGTGYGRAAPHGPTRSRRSRGRGAARRGGRRPRGRAGPPRCAREGPRRPRRPCPGRRGS